MRKSPPTRFKIVRLTRWRRELCRDYTIACLGNDKTLMDSIRTEYRLLGEGIAQLRRELAEQHAAVAAVCEWLEADKIIGY